MGSQAFYHYLIAVASCAVKYLVGVIYAGAQGFTFIEIWIIGSIGGVLGTVVFSLIGAKLRKILAKRRKPHQKINFKRAKRIRKFWHIVGLPGIALVAPFLSPMVSVFIAIAFREDTKRIMLWISVSLLIWTPILAYFAETLRTWIERVIGG